MDPSSARAGLPPPVGPPWDLPLARGALCFVDLEMTGLDARVDRVVEICVERWVGGALVDSLSSLVLPPERVGGAAHVHGLDAAALAGAPSFSALAPRVLEVMAGAAFVAHAAAWDVRFLNAELERAGAAAAVEHFIDTLTLARRAFALPRYSLEALAGHFGIERGEAHRAESDVRVLRGVFDRCVAVLAPVSVRDLWEVRIGERHARAAIVDACHAAIEHRAAVQITYRPSRKPPEPILFVVQDVRSDLDPPRVMGYQLPGRGRRELRADRILRVDPAPTPR